MKPSVIPATLKGKELYDFAVANEDLIIHAKKSTVKCADGLFVPNFFVNEKGSLVSKAASNLPEIPGTATKLNIDVVINTTNYFDSHMDVHIPGLWNKTIGDNKRKGFYLLKTHGRDFEDVIGEGLIASAQKLSWKDLGFDYTGVTEALMFSGPIDKDRNPYMFDQYAKRYVKQHSVGMQYARIVTCIDDKDYPVQKENWDKYRPMVINGDDVDESGIFWAVLEAKIIEGSAVLFGSNDLTPTANVEEVKEKQSSTEEEPVITTQEQPQKFDISKAIKETKFFN